MNTDKDNQNAPSIPEEKNMRTSLFAEKPFSQFLQIEPSALARWAAVPEEQKARIRKAIDDYGDFKKRFADVQAAADAPLTEDELELVWAWRGGGHDGVKQWLKKHRELQMRRLGPDDNLLNKILALGWYAEDGFSLCWLSRAALFKVLVEQGLIARPKHVGDKTDKQIDTLRKRVSALGLVKLPKTVVEIRDIEIKTVGKRRVLVIS